MFTLALSIASWAQAPQSTPQATTNSTATEQGKIAITATLGKPSVGDNNLTVKIADAMGMPVKGAKVTLSVAMTSMDMGTAHPATKDNGDGTYSAKVNFSMAGPWRVTAKVQAGGKTSKPNPPGKTCPAWAAMKRWTCLL